MVIQASTSHLNAALLISQSTNSLQAYICQLIDLKLLHLAAAHSGDGSMEVSKQRGARLIDPLVANIPRGREKYPPLWPLMGYERNDKETKGPASPSGKFCLVSSIL